MQFECDGVILNKGKFITSDDINIANNKNTCGYLFIGRFLKYLEEIADTENEHLFGTYPDITNENTCYNADTFHELKGLIECGYNEIKIKKNNQEITIKTCGYISSDTLSKELKDYMDLSLIHYLLGEEILNLVENAYLRFPNELESNERRILSSDITWEMNIKSKNGKKVTYKSEDIENLRKSNGNNVKSTNSDTSTEAETTKTNTNGSNINIINLIVSLLFQLILF